MCYSRTWKMGLELQLMYDISDKEHIQKKKLFAGKLWEMLKGYENIIQHLYI